MLRVDCQKFNPPQILPHLLKFGCKIIVIAKSNLMALLLLKCLKQWAKNTSLNIFKRFLNALRLVKNCIQTIVIAEDLFERYRHNTDFIQQYVFPGGMYPPAPVLKEVRRKLDYKLRVSLLSAWITPRPCAYGVIASTKK